ncbi:MAG TPA: tRNA uridine-5-carboxymethylaminomethyl(34) synthesis GTPase MnmE [Gemmatimonadaceae bacterium]|jgi:tRNA modification GTPase|nr:tRNA uridine-5-carboxymethylaminomethyl(34) synthesis GTPase MnmE [Gemmatimonadaceae bacterium]
MTSSGEAFPTLDVHAIGDGATIAAISTAAGRGALAVIRISGGGAPSLANQLLRPPPTEPRRAVHASFLDPDSGQVLDDVVAVLYRAPGSFTGEDLLEITGHGGSFAPTSMLSAIIRAGARQAEPGEFTRRAVLNGKLDLLQAEAIGDLIDARSTAGHRQALRQLDGELTRRVQALRQRILHVEALLAYDIDFPEEDDGPISKERVVAAADTALRDVRALLASAEQGTLIHEGALVVLAGAPNTGKSTLFNALLGEARAIVTEIPGTTRDAIEAVLDRPRWPLRLVDTAGLRETTDTLEQLGIETSARYLNRAALVLACGETTDDVEHAKSMIANASASPVLGVLTKRDLVAHREISTHAIGDLVEVSARTGDGLAQLLDVIDARLAVERGEPLMDSPGLTRARHRVAVSRAADELTTFITAMRDASLPVSIAAIHVRTAADALAELIGIVNTDDVLDVVFRQFCVGK